MLRRLRNRNQKHDGDATQKRIAALEKKIRRGAERFLLLDGDDLADAFAVLAGWRKERKQLATQIEDVTATGLSPSEEVERVMAERSTLRESFDLADPVRLRAAPEGLD